MKRCSDCPFCSGDPLLCDCIERRDCPRAGQLLHFNCGRCLQVPEMPAFYCGHAECKPVRRYTAAEVYAAIAPLLPEEPKP